MLIIKEISICFILKVFNFILILVTILSLFYLSCNITVVAKYATFVALSDTQSGYFLSETIKVWTQHFPYIIIMGYG